MICLKPDGKGVVRRMARVAVLACRCPGVGDIILDAVITGWTFSRLAANRVKR